MLLWIIVIFLFIYVNNIRLAKESIENCGCQNNSQCIQEAGKDDLCICKDGWKGDKCQTQINNVCFDNEDQSEEITQTFLDDNHQILKKRNNHNYNNYETQNLSPWRKIKEHTATIADLYQQNHYQECHGDSTCPPNEAMDINELQEWSKKLKKIREVKRCATDFCPLKDNKKEKKQIEVKESGNKVIQINTKQKESFCNQSSSIPQGLYPKMSLSPLRTTNMFNII
tara:strand:- start:245 stop:925 length:681 start_codon:yes stop_codon:yes gene_type:complete